MYNQEPSISADRTAQEIVGESMEDAFKAHYIAAQSGTGIFPEKEINEALKQFAVPGITVHSLRKKIAAIYEELRENGYFPVGVKQTGAIDFRTALKNKVTEQLEKDVATMPSDMKVVCTGTDVPQEKMNKDQIAVQVGRMKKFFGVESLSVSGIG